MEKPRSHPVPPADLLKRFDGRPVLITTADGPPVASGKLAVVDGDGAAVPQVHLEFVARTVKFVMPIPESQLFRFVGTWNGSHLVYALPPGEELWLQPPAEGGGGA